MRPLASFFLNNALFPFLGFLSLSLRIWFSRYTYLGTDELNLFEKALEFYLHGKLSTTGAAVVYSGTAIPGSLNTLLLAPGLYLSGGMPWGAGVWVAIVNFVSTLLIYQLCRKCFPRFRPLPLYSFILFAPWSICFTEIWNPSFLPLFSAIYFLSLYQLFEKPHHFWGWFGLAFSIPCMFQFHLSVVIFLFLTFFLFLSKLLRFRVFLSNLPAVICGFLVGSLSFLPYFIETGSFGKIFGGSAGVVFSNTIVYLESVLGRFLDFPKFFLRFLSFSTAETTRFIGGGGGVQKSYELISSWPWIWIPALISVLGSLWMIGMGLRFYLNGFQNFKRIFEQRLEDPRKKFVFVTWIIPWITYLLFLFSIKGPSAHTFWVLLPISFYPFLQSLESSSFRWNRKWSIVFSVYVVSGLLFSLGGYISTPHSSIQEAERLALQHYPRRDVAEIGEKGYIRAVELIYRSLRENEQKSGL